MLHFFKLIRFKNLFIIAFCQIIFKYLFLNQSGADLTLSNLYFILFLTATLLIAAAGYIINDIYDLESDKINKPNQVIINTFISEKSAFTIYIILNIIGLILAYFVSYKIDHLNYGLIFLVVAFGLLKYAQNLKSVFIINNLIIAFMVSLSVLTLGIYDIIPSTNPSNTLQQLTAFSIVLDYTFFALLVNFIREIVKDIEDVNGDKKRQIKTFISVCGIKKTKIIIGILNGILIVSIIYYTYNYFSFKVLPLIYMIILVIIPAVLNFILLIKATNQKDFKNSTQLLKIIMIFGVGSIAIIALMNYYEY